MMKNKKLGYYKVDDVEFESKIQAYMYARTVNQQVQWNFNDEVFSSYDWTIEPDQSLDYLYDKRARELREKYDYLMISYSGGADSHNALMSFVRQGLHIDEIIVNTLEKGWSKFTTIDPNNTSSSNNGAEHYLQTIPRLKEIENLIPNTKITICDLTDHVHDSFNSVGDASWVLDKREALNPIGITRFNYIYFSEVRKRFDKQKSLGIVLGVEKPKSAIVNDKFWMRFVDRAANMITIINHLDDYDNTEVEYFYWSPDCVPMLIKQGHVMRRWLMANPDIQYYWNSKTLTYKIARLYHERLLREVIYYSTWNNDWYQADKATKDWYSEFDNWFILGAEGTSAKHIWNEGIAYVTDKLSPYLRLNDDTNTPDGLQSHVKKYLIGTIPSDH
jgi:hypothetical protein